MEKSENLKNLQSRNWTSSKTVAPPKSMTFWRNTILTSEPNLERLKLSPHYKELHEKVLYNLSIDKSSRKTISEKIAQVVITSEELYKLLNKEIQRKNYTKILVNATEHCMKNIWQKYLLPALELWENTTRETGKSKKQKSLECIDHIVKAIIFEFSIVSKIKTDAEKKTLDFDFLPDELVLGIKGLGTDCQAVSEYENDLKILRKGLNKLQISAPINTAQLKTLEANFAKKDISDRRFVSEKEFSKSFYNYLTENALNKNITEKKLQTIEPLIMSAIRKLADAEDRDLDAIPLSILPRLYLTEGSWLYFNKDHIKVLFKELSSELNFGDSKANFGSNLENSIIKAVKKWINEIKKTPTKAIAAEEEKVRLKKLHILNTSLPLFSLIILCPSR